MLIGIDDVFLLFLGKIFCFWSYIRLSLLPGNKNGANE